MPEGSPLTPGGRRFATIVALVGWAKLVMQLAADRIKDPASARAAPERNRKQAGVARRPVRALRRGGLDQPAFPKRRSTSLQFTTFHHAWT